MGSENCYSKDLFYKFLWIISEGLCDINLKGTVYIHSFVLNLVFFFVNKYVNSLMLVAGFTFISFSLRLARNSILTNTNTPVKASNLQRYPSRVLLKAKMDLSHRKWTKERLSGTDISEYQSVLGAYRISGNAPSPSPSFPAPPLPSRCFDFIFTLIRIS